MVSMSRNSSSTRRATVPSSQVIPHDGRSSTGMSLRPRTDRPVGRFSASGRRGSRRYRTHRSALLLPALPPPPEVVRPLGRILVHGHQCLASPSFVNRDDHMKPLPAEHVTNRSLPCFHRRRTPKYAGVDYRREAANVSSDARRRGVSEDLFPFRMESRKSARSLQ